MSEERPLLNPRVAVRNGSGCTPGHRLARLLISVAPGLLLLFLFAAEAAAQLPPDAPTSKAGGAQQLLTQAQAAHKEVPASSLHRAISLLNRAQTMFANAGDARGQIEALLEQADIWRDLSEFRQATAAYSRAEQLARSQPDMMTSVLNGRARVYLDQWDSENARVAAEEALRLSRARGDRRAEAMALIFRGESSYLRTDDGPALRDVAEGIAIAEAEHDAQALAYGIRANAWVDEDQGRYRHAIELMHRAGELFRGLGDLREETDAAVEAASLQSLIGDRQSVMSIHISGLRLSRVMGQRLTEGWALEALGADYARLNNHRTAIEYYRASLNVFRQIKHISGQYSASDVLCRSELAVGQVRAAMRSCIEARDLATQVRDPKREAVAMKTLGDALRVEGATDRAQALYTQAAQISHNVNDTRFEAEAHLSLGQLRESTQDHDGAIEDFRAALALSTAVENADAMIAAHYEIARAQRLKGSLADARTELEAALKLAEEQRLKVGSGALRSSYFTSLRQSYELYAQVLMDLHQRQPDGGFDRMALEQSEKAHARTLLDSLVERAAEVDQVRDPETAQRVRDLRAKIAAASNERMRLLAFGGSQKQLDANIERIRLLNSEYDATRSAHETAAATISELVSALSADQIRQEVLDLDTTLLEYLLGDEAGLAWAVTPQGIESFALPPRRTLENDVQRWHALTLARKPHPGESAEAYGQRVSRADRDLKTVAAKLACTLLGPVISQLKTPRLAIVPDGGLEYIAFGALPLDGCGHAATQPLVSRFEIVVVPSASSVRALRRELQTRPAPTAGIAVLADPVFTPDDPRVGGSHPAVARPRVTGALGAAMRDLGWNSGIPRLPGTRLEARTIAAHANGVRVALDFDASLATALRPEMARYRILHFATHGLLDAEQPEFSGLILSLVDRKGKDENGYLSAQDIYEQRLLADLVVLSACDSGLGVTLRGEGVVGLARAFLHAGAARVVSSLWKVDDEATSELMRHFYDGMLRDQKPPAAALRYAQIQMMRQKRWSAPFYWAGFVLNGEWR
jgi:CHAT domain-containing protein